MSNSAQRYSGYGDVFGTVVDISEISRQCDCNYTVWYSDEVTIAVLVSKFK